MTRNRNSCQFAVQNVIHYGLTWNPSSLAFVIKIIGTFKERIFNQKLTMFRDYFSTSNFFVKNQISQFWLISLTFFKFWAWTWIEPQFINSICLNHFFSHNVMIISVVFSCIYKQYVKAQRSTLPNCLPSQNYSASWLFETNLAFF